MPEENEPETPQEPTADPAPEDQKSDVKDQLATNVDEFKSEHSKKAVLSDLAKERDARKAAEARIKEFEDRDKTESERAAERLAQAEKAAGDARRDAARYKVAAVKGVDPELLSGDDEESLTAHADRLLAWRGEPPSTTPQPDSSQGPRPQSPEAQQDAEYQAFYPTPNRK